jgi:hypothetical protein
LDWNTIESHGSGTVGTSSRLALRRDHLHPSHGTWDAGPIPILRHSALPVDERRDGTECLQHAAHRLIITARDYGAVGLAATTARCRRQDGVFGTNTAQPAIIRDCGHVLLLKLLLRPILSLS